MGLFSDWGSETVEETAHTDAYQLALGVLASTPAALAAVLEPLGQEDWARWRRGCILASAGSGHG